MSEHQSPLAASRVESTTTSATSATATGSARGTAPGLQADGSAARATGRRRSDRIISASAAMQEVVDHASGVARRDDLVVIAGQSGTGRKHVARAIHQWSLRAGGPLVEVQLAGSSEPAQTRELFGDGATAGALTRGQGGTVLLESADQLSANALSRLADAIRSTAASAATPGARARIVATVSEGAAETLSALTGTALGAQQIQIAPLARRTEDILPLAAHFLSEFAAEEGVDPIGFTADARRWLVEESWPGNVRELRERIRQAIRLAGQGAVSAEALMLSTEGEDVPSFKDAKRAFETRYVEGLLRRCSGNISRAARMAKKDRKDFYDVIRRTGVDPGQFRG